MGKIGLFIVLITSVIAAMFSFYSDICKNPVMRDDYSLVFEDNFDGDELDLSKWFHRSPGARRSGFSAPSQVKVKNGNLIIAQEYLTDGEYGEGWYVGAICAKRRFTRGYFECRCICNKTVKDGFWSAFWLQAQHPYEPEISKGGPGGAEIDILEAFVNERGVPQACFNIHVAGKKFSKKAEKGKLDSKSVKKKTMPTCFTEYHTYALEWTDKCYTLYIDGKWTACSTWGDGVSQVPEEIILSLEPSGNAPEDKKLTSEFIVDYVRVYQKK